MKRDAPSNDVYPRSFDPVVQLYFAGGRGGRFIVIVHPASCLDSASELASVARPGRVSLHLGEERAEGDALRAAGSRYEMFEWAAKTDGTLTEEWRQRRRRGG